MTTVADAHRQKATNDLLLASSASVGASDWSAAELKLRAQPVRPQRMCSD